MDTKVIIPPTLPTFGHPTVYVYPTVSPRVVVVPILTCIFGFPVLVMLIICALRYRARRARTMSKKSHTIEASVLELTSGPSILASRCSNGKGPRQKKRKKKTLVRFKPMPEIDLDTVVEEKSEFDAEMTASDMLPTPEELVIPEDEPPASFRAYRYMGPTQGSSPLRTSPHKTPQLSSSLRHVSEEGSDVTSELHDGDSGYPEASSITDSDADTAVTSPASVDSKGRSEAVCSSGSSDSDTVGTCFSLSPKQVTKSPTAVHLALKKLDGVMKRRHSSPVKVNLSKNRFQRLSTKSKANYSLSSQDGLLMPTKIIMPKEPVDYIDRELMPDIKDITPRSHSVKQTRRQMSVHGKRQGQSLKVKSKSVSQNIPQVVQYAENKQLTSSLEMFDYPILDSKKKKNDVTTCETQGKNDVTTCEVHILNERSEIRTPNPDVIGSPRACDRRTTKIGSDDDKPSSGSSSAVLETNLSLCDSMIAIQNERIDSPESPKQQQQQQQNTLKNPRLEPSIDGGTSEMCEANTDLSLPDAIVGGHDKTNFGSSKQGSGLLYSSNSERLINSEHSLKYKRDCLLKSHCQKCSIHMEHEEEKSTLV